MKKKKDNFLIITQLTFPVFFKITVCIHLATLLGRPTSVKSNVIQYNCSSIKSILIMPIEQFLSTLP